MDLGTDARQHNNKQKCFEEHPKKMHHSFLHCTFLIIVCVEGTFEEHCVFLFTTDTLSTNIVFKSPSISYFYLF